MQLTRGVRARTFVLIVWALVASAAVAACGSSGSGSASSASTQTGASTTAAQGSTTGGQSAAQKIVATYEKGFPPYTAASLAKTPPKGVKVAGVVCTVPTCETSAELAPYKALGWDYEAYPYDIGQGPPALDKSLANAIASHPQYIVLMAVFPQATFQSELSQAIKAGIGVVLFASGGNVIPGTIGCIACEPQQTKTGALQADMAVADGARSGQIAYASDPTAAVLNDEYHGAEQEVARLLSGAKTPLIQLSQADTPTQNSTTVVNFLQRNPGVKYVIFSVESLASGVPQALAQDKLSAKVITQAPAATDLEEIAAGSQFGTVASEDVAAVWSCADLLARTSIKSAIPAAIRAPVGWHQIIGKSNIAQVKGKPTEPPNFEATLEKAWHVS